MNANTRKFKKIINVFICVHLRVLAENHMFVVLLREKIE